MENKRNLNRAGKQKLTKLPKRLRAYTSPIFAATNFSPALLLQLMGEPTEVLRELFARTPILRSPVLGFPKITKLERLCGQVQNREIGGFSLEARWLCVQFEHFKEQISEFLANRLKVERFILLGKYKAADETRLATAVRIGQSLWNVEADYFLTEMLHGLQGNKELLAKHQKMKRLRNWTKALMYFFSQRVEGSSSAEEYSLVCRVLQAGQDAILERTTFAYFGFHLDYFAFDLHDSLNYILHMEEGNPIVDRYLTFVKCVQKLLVHNKLEQVEGIEGEIRLLANVFEDSHLKLAGEYLGNGVNESERSSLLYDALHEYTLGNYQSSLNISTDALKKYPECFEFYELATKSTVRLGKQIENPFE